MQRPLLSQSDVVTTPFKCVLSWSHSKQDVSRLCLAGNPALRRLPSFPCFALPNPLSSPLSGSQAPLSKNAGLSLLLLGVG